MTAATNDTTCGGVYEAAGAAGGLYLGPRGLLREDAAINLIRTYHVRHASVLALVLDAPLLATARYTGGVSAAPPALLTVILSSCCTR
jgi:hypothetical protein